KVWAVFEVYEKDLAKVKVGDQIQFQPNGSSQTYQAQISFISPAVEAGSRIVEVRADINNASGILKPDMFIKASLVSSNASEISVPRSAVLWTGKRSIVYVKLPNNEGFELREIELGNKFGESYQVVSGLQTGEEVVTNGAFTLDAESQLKGKISMMSPEASVGGNPEIGFIEIELPKAIDFSGSTSIEFQKQLEELTREYVILKDAMVEGNERPIRDQALKVDQVLEEVNMSLVKGEAHLHWMALLNPMKESLNAINNSNNRDEQRLQFINLSKAIINALDSFGITGGSTLYVQFCPMANNDKGATWVSLNEEIVNPYFGDMMLHCGNVEYTIEKK
ncbi:MAG TPA: efflux RND transporter periplasmic adaptor subunit, partial [Roseivirga sp.]